MSIPHAIGDTCSIIDALEIDSGLTHLGTGVYREPAHKGTHGRA